MVNFVGDTDNYDKTLPPRINDEDPLLVNVSVHIISLPKIDISGLRFTVDFFLILTWTDYRYEFVVFNVENE